MISISPANFEEFRTRASHAKLVAIVRTIPADLLTPLVAYLRVATGANYSFLFESVEGGEQLARYSFLGANPTEVIRTRKHKTYIERADRELEVREQNAIDYLREHFSEVELHDSDATAPLAGGAVGYLGYGASVWFDSAIEVRPYEGDDACFMLFDTVLAFDHARQQLQIRALARIEHGASEQELRSVYEAAVQRTEAVVELLRRPAELQIVQASLPQQSNGFSSNLTKAAFEDAVCEAQSLIAAGECYQAVLSQQFTRETPASPVAIYRALRMTNPSPYMFLFRLGEESLIGASPEMLVRSRGSRLEYRPIAGTRLRGQTPAEDEALALELLDDEKERSEHVMLVDLGRNDLGRVAGFGSVKVEQMMKVEKYSHVQHLVTEISAELRPECDRFDALGACFPAGTVTGAPKIRAMKAIAELEPSARGVYSGAVLYADYAGNLDSCIAIRTIELRDGIAKVQAGAGIVADSVPSSEFGETVNKSRALQNAVQLAEAGL